MISPAPPLNFRRMVQAADFISRWVHSGASERANYQLFLSELCPLLEVEPPQPSVPDEADNAYVFEKRVNFTKPDGSTTTGRIDLYKRACFVLEAKQGAEDGATRIGHGTRGTGQWDQAMVRAKRQGEDYIHALPLDEGRPPFLLVVDVGHSIEIYSEFSRTGGIYIPYPDPRSHRLFLADLAKPEVRERLRKIWTDPLSLDPSRISSRVTEEIAARLAKLAQSMETSGNPPSLVAGFLMRCIFTMFAEDIGLLPKGRFGQLLETFRGTDLRGFVPVMEEVWRTMTTGGFSVGLRETVLKFNGGLFEEHRALSVTAEELDLLIAAAKADWREVEPAIFGTLLERSLDPTERHKFGAHFTPRAYVERLVLPTIIEPLRAEWDAVQAAASALIEQDKEKAAVKEVAAFHRRLCHVRVLDPACGSGNFLYVTLEHLKRLEGEIIDTLTRMGETQEGLELAGETVHPSQFLGLELNPRAAVLAELCLWIGYLQWHFRTRGNINPPEPVISKFHTVECRDAVLAYDGHPQPRKDAEGRFITQWDGRTYKPHPTTGEEVPDESARIPVYDYANPRPATWPAADFIIGNPPFIGPGKMRQALGDGYVETLRKTLPHVPESADFVMYWWDLAAELVRRGKVRQFGLITTNSLRQTFARRVLQRHMEVAVEAASSRSASANKRQDATSTPPLSLRFAVPDHPWVDSASGAAVRIAMTVGAAGTGEGVLATVERETDTGEGFAVVELASKTGLLHANLTIGVDTAKAVALRANGDISNRGVQLIGAGFIVTPGEARALGLGRIPGIEKHIRDYRNGKDLTNRPRGVKVIDLFGLPADEVRDRFPEIYQWVSERVKPERDQNKRDSYRLNWWIHGEPRKAFRPALNGLPRYIATVETTKHRVFQFLDASILPDNMLVCIASDEAALLGILSSRHHVAWALAQGGTLEDRPRYNKTRCFETFPFPDATPDQKERIGALAERLDAHRKRQLAAHPHLTLTGLYNVLEKLRVEAASSRSLEADVEAASSRLFGAEKRQDAASTRGCLSPKERAVYEDGLVGVLRELHDELDAAVAESYGWPPDLETDEILARLLDLNTRRAAEEAAGTVRWLRPEYQAPEGSKAVQAEMKGIEAAAAVAPAPKQKIPWPAKLAEQAALVRKVAQDTNWTTEAPLKALSAHFSGVRAPTLRAVVEALVALGQLK
ncbi:MAG: class I SAM-dependent DNA methyltransferase [Opitutales bacterium]|nr:class I SAM-dependent DNA methyltransferase [Opitutales bacterium]